MSPLPFKKVSQGTFNLIQLTCVRLTIAAVLEVHGQRRVLSNIGDPVNFQLDELLSLFVCQLHFYLRSMQRFQGIS